MDGGLFCSTRGANRSEWSLPAAPDQGAIRQRQHVALRRVWMSAETSVDSGSDTSATSWHPAEDTDTCLCGEHREHVGKGVCRHARRRGCKCGVPVAGKQTRQHRGAVGGHGRFERATRRRTLLQESEQVKGHEALLGAVREGASPRPIGVYPFAAAADSVSRDGSKAHRGAN